MFKGTPVADLGNEEPVRQVLAANGRIERVPGGRFVKVVKPSGSVCRVPIHNGRASKEGANDPYKAHIEQSLWRSGSVPYGRCLQTLDYEITTGWLPPKWYRGRHPIVPPHLRDRNPCRTAANGGPINQANACKCVEELIEYRKKWQAEQMAKIETKTEAMLHQEASKGLAGAVKEVAEVVRELKNGPRAEPPKPVHPDEVDDAGEGEPEETE